jgi:hypothetical protein
MLCVFTCITACMHKCTSVVCTLCVELLLLLCVWFCYCVGELLLIARVIFMIKKQNALLSYQSNYNTRHGTLRWFENNGSHLHIKIHVQKPQTLLRKHIRKCFQRKTVRHADNHHTAYCCFAAAKQHADELTLC